MTTMTVPTPAELNARLTARANAARAMADLGYAFRAKLDSDMAEWVEYNLNDTGWKRIAGTSVVAKIADQLGIDANLIRDTLFLVAREDTDLSELLAALDEMSEEELEEWEAGFDEGEDDEEDDC